MSLAAVPLLKEEPIGMLDQYTIDIDWLIALDALMKGDLPCLNLVLLVNDSGKPLDTYSMYHIGLGEALLCTSYG